MRRAPLVLLAALSLVAACNDDDAAAPAGDEPEATTTTTTEAPVFYEGHDSEVYADPAHWLCRPGDDGPCSRDLDATSVEADGSTSVERFEPVEDADLDCFYVYPTISRDDALNSDLEPAEDEEILVVRHQAARLGEVCRVFAPVYRQVTLTSLVSRISGQEPPPGDPEDAGEIAYADVLDAFRHYMANDNGGRGVVLIGHSQGAGVLNRLVREEIDGDDDLRERLVSALLLGSTVRVPGEDGADGDFENIPACSSPEDTGCVVSYAAFRDTAPPPENSFFGRPREGQGRALCTNPGSLDGGRATLQPYFPSVEQSILGGAETPVEWAEGVEVDTPFVTLPGLVEAECVDDGTFSYLEVTVTADPDDARIGDIGGDLTPEWGLHLVDVHLAMGDLVDLVRAQGEAFGE